MCCFAEKMQGMCSPCIFWNVRFSPKTKPPVSLLETGGNNDGLGKTGLKMLKQWNLSAEQIGILHSESMCIFNQIMFQGVIIFCGNQIIAG